MTKNSEIEVIPSDVPIHVKEFYIIDDLRIKTSDRIAMFGKTGSSKSSLAASYLIPHYDNWVYWDIKRENDRPDTWKGDKVDYEKISHSPEELEKDISIYNKILYQPDNLEISDFDNLCKIVFYHKNILLYVDEASRISNPHKIPYWLDTIMSQGRSYNVGIINVSQRPHRIHQTMISEVEHLFIFQLNLQSDRDAIGEIIGFDTANEIINLPEFHFIYFNMNVHKGIIFSPIGERIEGEIPVLKPWQPSLREYIKIIKSRS